MATRIESKTKSESSNSLTVDFSPTQANDIILVFATVRSTGATLAVSGYTGIGTQTTNDACRSRPFIKIASAGETSITVTTGVAAAGMWVTVHIVRGIYTAGTAAQAVDASAVVSGATGYTMSSGSVTTNYANSLIFECASWDNAAIICDPSDCNLIASAGGLQVSGTRFRAAIGAVSTFTWTASNNANAGMAWTVALRDDGSSDKPVVLNDGRDYLHLLGGYSALTALAPDSVTGLTAIDGVNMNTVANTTAGTLTLGSGLLTTAPWQMFVSSWACTQNLTATAWVGNFFALPATADVSGKSVFVPYALGASALDSGRVGPKGNIVVLVDSANKWIAYQMLPQSLWTVSGYGTVVIKPGTSDYLDASLTTGSPDIDLTDIVTIGYFHQRAAGTATSVTVYFGPPMIENAVSSIVGGGATYPINAKRIAQLLVGANLYPDHCGFQGNGQLILKSKLQFGDGSTAAYTKLTAQSIETPSSDDTKYRAGASAAGVYLKGSASDTIDLRSAIFSTEVAQPFEIDAAHSTSATVLTAGLSVVGPWDVVWIDGETFSGISFTGCDAVATKGADVSGCTFASTVSTGATVVVDTTGSVISGSTIDGTGAAYHVALGAAVTAITMNGVTLTGTPGTDKIYSALASGTLTITVDGTGTSLSASDVTFVGGSSATASVVAPQPTLDAPVLANTRVVLWNRTTSAELDNVWVTGTSWSKVITSGASSSDVLDLYAFREGYLESVATIIYSGVDATFALEQAVDPAIDYYRTTESITDYTTLSEFNFYAPDIYIQSDDADGATSLKRLFIYYNGSLTTEDGARYMRGGITFRSAFDVVINRSVTPMAVDNVSATLGLYFTDESVIRVTTDDGTSWIAPPSAPGSIRYAFGVSPGQIETGVSGLTGPESAQLMGIPSATITRTEKLLRNKMITDPASGVLTIYDDDGTTPLVSGDIFEDAAGSQPYRGQGAERRERLT